MHNYCVTGSTNLVVPFIGVIHEGPDHRCNKIVICFEYKAAINTLPLGGIGLDVDDWIRDMMNSKAHHR